MFVGVKDDQVSNHLQMPTRGSARCIVVVLGIAVVASILNPVKTNNLALKVNPVPPWLKGFAVGVNQNVAPLTKTKTSAAMSPREPCGLVVKRFCSRGLIKTSPTHEDKTSAAMSPREPQAPWLKGFELG